MRIRLIPAVLATTLIAPTAALAQAPAGEPPPAPPAPAAAPAQLVLTAERVGGHATVLAGSRIRLRGVVRPFVPGQSVTIRVVQGGRKVLVRRRAVLRSATGRSGSFLVAYTPTAAGPLTITASHLRTPELASAVARAVRVDVLPRSVSAGSSGRSVAILQQRLKALGYVTGSPGVLDGRTSRAVVAFRKYTGMARTASADRSFFQRLASGAGAFKVRYPQQGRHVEADLTHQVLALIGAGAHVERIYPISSGKPSTPTVLGTYRVYRQDLGTNAKGMVDASYFFSGYAIHGYAEVPTYAASHGCLRAPVPDARPIHDWLRHGTIVDVYYR